MARILVTGGTGYIGSHTTVELMQQGYDVTIVDNLSNSSIDVIDGIAAIVGRRPEFANIDCGNYVDLDGVFKTYTDIVGVIHFAANAKIRCERHYLLFLLHCLWPAGRTASACG